MAVLLMVMTTVSGAVAQSDSETITVQVMGPPPYVCTPVGTMAVDISLPWDESIEVPYGGGDSTNPSAGFQMNVLNAGCYQWSVSAQLDDFKLTSDAAVTIPASTFALTKSDSGATNPQRWESNSQPGWVRSLPNDAVTGMPTMPDIVTFAGSPTALGNVPLFSASTAANGTPGNSTAYFHMKMIGVPSDVAFGTYSSVLKVTVQGADE